MAELGQGWLCRKGHDDGTGHSIRYMRSHKICQAPFKPQPSQRTRCVSLAQPIHGLRVPNEPGSEWVSWLASQPGDPLRPCWGHSPPVRV